MKCKLAEFGECRNEFRPQKEWAEFCCDSHRKRWHYLARKHEAVEHAEAQRDERKMNGHATNGHDVAKPKLTLADLGLAPPKPQFKRRKLNTQGASERAR